MTDSRSSRVTVIVMEALKGMSIQNSGNTATEVVTAPVTVVIAVKVVVTVAGVFIVITVITVIAVITAALSATIVLLPQK